MQKERLPSPWDNRPTTLARPAALEKIEKRSSSGSRYGPHWPGRPAMSKPLRPRAATKPRGAALGWNTTERAWNAERPSGFQAVKTLRTPHQLGVHRSLTRPARRGAKNQRKKRKFSTIFKNFKRFLGKGSLRGRAETRAGDSNCGGLCLVYARRFRTLRMFLRNSPLIITECSECDNCVYSNKPRISMFFP